MTGGPTPFVADLNLAYEHVWAWFALHAGQRMQLMYYMFVSVSLVVAGYGATLNAHPPAACGIAVAGAVTMVGFRLLDVRTGHLVDAARGPLQHIERLLAASGVPDVNLVERTAERRLRYKYVIRPLAVIFALALAAAAIYALHLAGSVTPATPVPTP